jgi:hypothetical protein
MCYQSGVDAVKSCLALWRVPHGCAGVLLIAVFWPLNWLLPDATMRSAFFFFPLWLGYVLAVDALVLVRSGSSMRSRSRRDFLLLFCASAPAWWLFELINERTRNWEYLGIDVFNDFEYAVLCTISFSTVMPAVFETAELARTVHWVDRLGSGPRFAVTRRRAAALFLAGTAMLALTLLWPKYCYPLVWSAIFLILDPVNLALGRRHLFVSLNDGDWRPVISLSVGALTCGFFWELWNFYSYPKWIYHTPGAEFLHVFEMPLLGYGGYLPFAWELYALRNFFLPNVMPLRL